MARPKQVLLVVSAAVTVVYLDLFIVNVAFPEIGRDFPEANFAGLSWVLNAYAILFAALLVPIGRMADRLGHKRVFLAGLLVFTVASLLCAVAPSLEALVAARALQAAGAAALIPTSLALLLHAFPPERRAGAIAVWAAVGGVAAAAGPPLGGLLVEISWRLVFLVNLPIGIAAGFAAARILSESRDEHERRWPDLVGSVLLAAGVGLLALGLVKAPEWGWGSARVIGAFVAAALLVALFVARSARHPVPVVELSLLRVRSFAAASGSASLFNVAFAAMLLGSVVFLTRGWHYSILEAGLAIMPGPLLAAFSSLRFGQLAARIGPSRVAAPGALVFAAGCAWWALRLDASPDYLTEFLPAMILTGIGVGLVFAPLAGAAAASLPPTRFATGTAVLTMARQIGAVLGVAILVAVFGDPAAPGELFEAFERGYWFMALAAGLASLAALAIGRVGAPASARAPVASEAAA